MMIRTLRSSDDRLLSRRKADASVASRTGELMEQPMKRRFVSALFVLALAGGLYAADAATAPVTEALETSDSYILGRGDVLSIQVLHADEISRLLHQIDDRGECNLPIIGRTRAEGLTAPQLEEELRKKLRDYINDPQVTIQIHEYKSRPISIVGGVKNPGTHYLRGRTTLLNAIAMAGGLDKDAGGGVTIKRRKEYGPVPATGSRLDGSGEFYVADVFLRKLMQAESQSEIEIQPHDILLVPRVDLVSILGEVGKPGVVPLGETGALSVLEALSQSGGLKPTADASKARILRPIMGGPRRAELPIDLASIMRGKAKDMPLVANDILVVPNSRGRVVLTRALELLVGPATTLGTAVVLTR